ncbi:MAG: PHP domain-containing protein [Chloroflexota bacterium]
MVAPDAYCELHVHSNFSFLDGASHPEDLVARAATIGMPALALTDHAGLYGAVRLWKAAEQTRTDEGRAAGLSPVQPILGVELAIPRDERELRAARRGRRMALPLRGPKASRGWPGEHHAGPSPGDHLVLLARDPDGYAALSRLVSAGHLAGEKAFPVFEAAQVAAALVEARGHLIGLSGCRNGEVPRRLLAGERAAARAAAERWARCFSDGDFCVELSHHLLPDDDWLVSELASLADETGLPTVVTNEVHYAEPANHRLQDVLVAIRHGASLDDTRELRLPNAEYDLKTGPQIAAIGAGLPDPRARRAWHDGMARAAAIGQACRLDLGFERYRFPGFTVPDGETPFSYLYQLAQDGLRRRYRPITKRALEQLTHELSVIDRTNLSEFFLIVWDLMEFARRNGIIGQGRGSAGDSIVAYCLGITKVDPIEHKLLFERFINEARALPDIDIDFDVNRREEIIQYLYRRYGTDHAAMVCNVITYRARSAVREVAKALAFPAEVVDRVAKALDTRDASEVAADLALDGEFGWLFEELGQTDAEADVGTDTGDAAPLVVRSNDNPWHFRSRPTLRPDLAAAEARAREAAGDHDGRPYSESGWYPPRRPKALDQSSVQVRHEGWERQRYAAGAPAAGDPSGHDGHVPVDPESGMQVDRRPRPSVLAEAPPGEAVIQPRNRWQWLLALCAEIDGFPRHLGIHVGGMVVTRTPITELVPIERATMPGRVVTEYDKEDVEALGLVKIDLLSLRTLGAVSDAVDRIERDTGQRPDLDALAHDDPDVFRSIRAADTVGVFQVESRAQMQALPKAHPERFEDLVVQVAIIRPGPVQGNAVHPYLRRRAGTEEVIYAHPSLQPILEDTLGVILYQEQVMQIAITVCGYSATEADIFRKAMGSHRSHQAMQRERDRFITGALRTGLTEPDAEDLFRRCSAFAEFGFARAHAAAFAKITYDTAWLRLRYPAHYLAGLLNNQPLGFYSPATLVNDARRHGLTVLPVDVNRSAWEHETERIGDSADAGSDGDPTRDFAVRLGLRQVKGIDEAARVALERERAIGPYRSVRDFVARTGLAEPVVERLIAIGAFDWTDIPRRELLWQLRATLPDADPQRPPLGLTDAAAGEVGATLPPMSRAERVAADYRELGLSPTTHAVELFRQRLTERGVLTVRGAGEQRNGATVRMGGVATSIQHPMTAKGFVFLALEDETGMMNITLRPDVYRRYRAVLHRHPLLVIDGRLQVEGAVLNVVARHLEPVEAVIAEPADPARQARFDLTKQRRMFR